ncbi:MAG: phosphate acyltransferase PlsX [Phycisphaerales bacterium]|nr:phosphate acyltransferase PlsX [Phycisphaerales bacterium]
MATRIALDAMGGDHAPGAIVRGALEAVAQMEDVVVVLVGREDVIHQEIRASGPMPERLEVVHASEVVEMDETPTEALRQKKDSSLMVMAKLAAAGEVDAIISAGNTGACAAAAQLRMRPLKCISRPGIAVTLPTFYGPVVLCDVGANIQSKPHHLYEYAVMSTLYAEQVVGIKSPRVGLVSIGEESRKGTEVVKQTHELLSGDSRINFVGNVEGGELFQNRCEVAVSDGFVGNILLKFIEGLSEGLFQSLTGEFRAEDPATRERFEGVLQRLWARHDYSEYGGAPLLGVDGVCIICHGRSQERAIRNAVKVARSFLQHRINDSIVARLGDATVAG